MAIVVFDIETGPLPDDQLRELCPPFDPLKVDGVKAEMLQPFDPESVKYGNMKDETLKAKKFAECRDKHEAERVAAGRKIEEARAGHFGAFVEEAALHAETCNVVAIGFRGKTTKIHGTSTSVLAEAKIAGVEYHDAEESLLRAFWDLYRRCAAGKVLMVGHNIKGFDLRILMQRSFMLGVPVPAGVLDRGRYWNDIFVDTMERWGCGAFKYIGLDALARLLGLGSKPKGDHNEAGEEVCCGKTFYRWWRGDPKQHAEAVAYLTNDLDLPWEIAGRFNIT